MSEKKILLPAAGWQCRPYQRHFWRALETGTKRACIVWHRRAGKGQSTLNWTACASAERKGLYVHVLPTMKQARKVIWDGLDNEGRPMMSAFPADYVIRKRDDEMKIWLASGSQFQVGGADEPDVAWRGANVVGVIFDEYATTAKMKTLWDNVFRPMLTANEGWAIFTFTPQGRNHGYVLAKMAEENPDWFYQLLTVNDTWYKDEHGEKRPVIRKEDIDADRKSGMSESRIGQEYFCLFSGPLESAFYGDLMRRADEEGRIGEVPWDVRHPVVTAWDLGIMDHMAVWYCQEVRGETRFIDYHEARDLSFEQHLSMVLSKPYAYVNHIGPHDLKHRGISSGHSCYEVARNFGVYFRCAPKLLVRDGIAAARAVLQQAHFDSEKCALGIQSLREYRRQRDEANDDYLEAPVHDRWSHGADALRTYAIGRVSPGWQGGPRLFQPMSIV